MRKSAPARPHNRGGIWYLVRRVPKEFEELDARRPVRISTDIAVAHDPKGVRAAQVVRKLDAELGAYWRALRDGQSAEARTRFDAAQTRARALGLTYHTADELAAGSVTELFKRIKLLVDSKKIDDESEVAAVLGGEARPAILLSDLLDEVEALASTKLALMSEGQRRKWRNPRRRAIENFITVVGDKPVRAITRSDSIAFRRWWQNRIAVEDLDIGTANKDIGNLSKMLHTLDMTHEIGIGHPFAGLRIEGAVKRQRSAFTAEHVATKIIVPGGLNGLNDEARDITYIVAALGMRPAEVCFLNSRTIHLDTEIPYISIEPDGYILKTAHSRRELPLTGLALKVMTRNPDGFPRYRDKAGSLSAVVNKVMDARGLLPSDNHSLYSLRHTFEDRLTAIEAPEKIIAVLMGHKWQRPKYGAGPTLAHKREWLQRIEFQ